MAIDAHMLKFLLKEINTAVTAEQISCSDIRIVPFGTVRCNFGGSTNYIKCIKLNNFKFGAGILLQT